ncbi:MAG: MFS transporter [Actinomycetota bacterium]
MRTERAAVTSLFFVNGAMFSSFFARLPAIKAELEATDGQLGLALFAATVALVIAQPLAGALAQRFGARGPALAGAFGSGAGLPLAALVPSVGLLALTLFAAFFSNGVLDVAINVEGVAVERRLGRRVLSSMHAAFSFGAMAGAGGGALAAAAGLEPEAHLAVVAVVTLGVAVVAGRGLAPNPPAGPRGPSFARPSVALLALGAAAFCVLLAEGSVTDWSAVFLSDEAGAGEAVAALGLAVFSLLMATGRLGGDGLAERFGARTVVRCGGLLAAAGLALALATAEPAPSILGFGLMGAGLSATFPLIVAAAARTEGLEEAPAIAAVSGLGYVGLMAGPATIGALSDAAGLRSALLLVVALSLLAAVLAGRLGRRT